MNNSKLLENDYIINNISNLIKSQQLILDKLTNILNNNIEDNLEISFLLEEINSKINILISSMNNQEEHNEELKIDISKIKDTLSLINNKLKD